MTQNIILSALLTADVCKQQSDTCIPPQFVKHFYYKLKLWAQVFWLFFGTVGTSAGKHQSGESVRFASYRNGHILYAKYLVRQQTC